MAMEAIDPIFVLKDNVEEGVRITFFLLLFYYNPKRLKIMHSQLTVNDVFSKYWAPLLNDGQLKL